MVNTLLTEIDGVDGHDGVVTVAACNHPQRLGSAPTRNGRLNRCIRLDYALNRAA